jgi:hypothetical protein
MLGTDIEFSDYLKPQPNDIIFPSKQTYTIMLPFDINEESAPNEETIMFKKLQLKGPINAKQLIDDIIKFYKDNPDTDNFEASDMQFYGFDQIAPFTYMAYAYPN